MTSALPVGIVKLVATIIAGPHYGAYCTTPRLKDVFTKLHHLISSFKSRNTTLLFLVTNHDEKEREGVLSAEPSVSV